jgi:hypothetical protein
MYSLTCYDDTEKFGLFDGWTVANCCIQSVVPSFVPFFWNPLRWRCIQLFSISNAHLTFTDSEASNSKLRFRISVGSIWTSCDIIFFCLASSHIFFPTGVWGTIPVESLDEVHCNCNYPQPDLTCTIWALFSC